jgi:WD40 repeat protein
MRKLLSLLSIALAVLGSVTCPAADLQTGDAPRLVVQTGHTGLVGALIDAIAMSQNERLLASVASGSVILWDVPTGRQLRTFAGFESVTSASF